MELDDLALAAIANYMFVHPHGHISQGYSEGYPMRVDYRNAIERWMTDPPTDPEARARINAAGFKASDDVGRAIQGTELGPEWYLSTAIQKAVYPALVKKLAPMSDNPAGDMGELRKYSGNKEARNAYYLSALADIMKVHNPKQPWSVGVEVMPRSTAVGPVFHMSW